ncbi:MAG: hypothetical protein COA43_11220 [Robiginitomaculum sp.]|nr:MAG: hypothetical protein COA43_11220 [Robiginitomaculum sp.]
MIECWIAQHNDMQALLGFARAFHAKSPFKDYPFSPSGSKQCFEQIMLDPNAVIFMHEHGCIGATISNYPFCEMRFAKELFWFSENHGAVLLKAYHHWAKEKGAQIDLMTSIESPESRTKLLHRALRRKGYAVIEYTHMRVL